MYKAWLYTNKISTTAELRGNSQPAETTKSAYVDLICCWGMGQTLGDVKFQNMVMEEILRRLQAWTGTGTNPFVYALTSSVVGSVYAETAIESPLRRLIVDTAVRLGKVEDFEHFRNDPGYPLGFVKDLMVVLAKEKESQQCLSLPSQQEPVEWLQSSVPSAPSMPFYDARLDFGSQQQPRSILRGPSCGGNGCGEKQVHFEGNNYR